jgi:hypothetical protein
MARSPTDTIRFLTLGELARLFAVVRASPRNRALFLIAYRHGLRASEVGLLLTDDLDFRALRIMVLRLKGSHSGAHPMQPDEAKALAVVPIDGVVRPLWREAVVDTDANGQVRVNRLTYEICVLEALRERLRSKEIWNLWHGNVRRALQLVDLLTEDLEIDGAAFANGRKLQRPFRSSGTTSRLIVPSCPTTAIGTGTGMQSQPFSWNRL